MSPFAEPIHVTELTLEAYTGAEEMKVRALIRSISGRIRSRLPSIDLWISEGSVDPVMVQDVVVEVTIRALDALTRGLGVVSETHPEYSYRLSDAAAASVNSITAEEWASLTPQSRRPRGAFSIIPG